MSTKISQVIEELKQRLNELNDLSVNDLTILQIEVDNLLKELLLKANEKIVERIFQGNYPAYSEMELKTLAKIATSAEVESFIQAYATNHDLSHRESELVYIYHEYPHQISEAYPNIVKG